MIAELLQPLCEMTGLTIVGLGLVAIILILCLKG